MQGAINHSTIFAYMHTCKDNSSAHPDLCSDLPELEIVSLLSEGQPNYTLRADSVFGYDHDDWLHTPLLPPEVALGLTHEQIAETLKYFCEYCFTSQALGCKIMRLSLSVM